MKYTEKEMKIVRRWIKDSYGFAEPLVGLYSLKNYVIDIMMYYRLQGDTLRAYIEQYPDLHEECHEKLKNVEEKEAQMRQVYDILNSMNDDRIVKVDLDALGVEL